MTVATASPGLATAEPEFTFTPADFEAVRRLIHQRAGISLHAGKQAMVYGRLSRRLRATRFASFSGYLAWLQTASGTQADAEWQEFVNCLTTHLTQFFREEHHFLALAEDLVARAAITQTRPLRIWCNAAATGEEPYSLAMTVLETLGRAARVQIVCSDIDTQVLATAQRGVYAADARGLSTERRKRHFLRGTGQHSGEMRVKPELARLIGLRRFNLASPSWASLGQPFDLVFCRNVMIYFDHATQRRVLQQMHAAMQPGGLLYAGHCENFSEAGDLFRLRGQTIYERV